MCKSGRPGRPTLAQGVEIGTARERDLTAQSGNPCPGARGTSGSAPGSRTGPGRLTAGPGGHLGTAPRHLRIVFVPRAPARRRTSPRKAGTGAPRKDDLTAEPRNRDATDVGPYRGMRGPGRPGTTTSPYNVEIGTRRTSDLTAEGG